MGTVLVPAAVGRPPVPFGYRLLRPPDLEPGQLHPLILFLHGAGERGSDNSRQIAYLPAWLAEPAWREAFPCYVLAPQCREDDRWRDVSSADAASTPQAAEPTPDLAAAAAALATVVAEEAVDTRRIYLTGLSMGGFGAWELATRMIDRFAALLPICGGGDESTAARLKDLPIWCFHGAEDVVVPVERSRSMIAAVQAAGGSPRYSELAGVGHDAWTTAYRDRDVLEWLFAQRRPL
jgi:predicted peptidase